MEKKCPVFSFFVVYKGMTKKILTLLLLLMFSYALAGRYEPVRLERPGTRHVRIEIKGGIQNPGTYELPTGATVEDAIEEAGGLHENADLSRIALLAELRPDDLIVIPLADPTQAALVSINAASSEQLQTLPGVGPAIAARIIEYREQTPFQALEDIQNVKGIGEKMFEKIKEQICL